jgi:hypothetical protein
VKVGSRRTGTSLKSNMVKTLWRAKRGVSRGDSHAWLPRPGGQDRQAASQYLRLTVIWLLRSRPGYRGHWLSCGSPGQPSKRLQ